MGPPAERAAQRFRRGFPLIEEPIHSWVAEVRTPCGEGAAEVPQRGRAHTLMGRRGFHPLMHTLYNTTRAPTPRRRNGGTTVEESRGEEGLSLLLPENPLTLALQRFPHFLPPHANTAAQRFPPPNRMANTLVGAPPGVIRETAPWYAPIFLVRTTPTRPSGRGALGGRRGFHPPPIGPILLSGLPPASCPKTLPGMRVHFWFTRLGPALPGGGPKLGAEAPTPRPLHLPSDIDAFCHINTIVHVAA